MDENLGVPLFNLEARAARRGAHTPCGGRADAPRMALTPARAPSGLATSLATIRVISVHV